MTKIKRVRTIESDRFVGYRRDVDTGKHPMQVNSRSLESVIPPNTLPMESVIVPIRPTQPQRAPKNRFGGGEPMGLSYAVEQRRAPAQRMHDAAQHSPEVESPWSNTTLKHPAFTSRRRRNDQEQNQPASPQTMATVRGSGR